MSKSIIFNQIKRAIAVANFAENQKISSHEASQRLLEMEKKRFSSRREFLKNSGMSALALGLGSTGLLSKKAMASTVDVGIVGAGLAGLVAAYELKKAGVIASVYEASNRAGGRQYSLRGLFPGQVAERGGELIDNLHTVMKGYAREFNLELEDLSKEPGDVFYYFNNQLYDESIVVDQFREFVSTMRDDLNNLSNEINAFNFTEEDRTMDLTSIEEYLSGDNAKGYSMGPIAKEAVRQAYVAEYGLSASEQSALNFLFFIHSDRRSKFQPFGVYSDERYHVKNGNDLIAQNLTARLGKPVDYEMKLVKISKTPAQRIELTFIKGNKVITRTHEAVVITLPFSVLRDVELHSSLGLSNEKNHAIRNLGYGYNAKMMIGMNGRPWLDLYGSNGSSYSNLSNLQATWETNPALATSSRGIITDYSGSSRGLNLDTNNPQRMANLFMDDFEKIYPGSKAYLTKKAPKGDLVVHLEHWPSNPLSKGSYTAYRMGEFTTIAGHEGTAQGNLFFAGEHTNSFYEWQGFMEGACISGLKAASDILQK